MKRALLAVVAVLAFSLPAPEASGQYPLPQPNAYKFDFWQECIPGCPMMCECTINSPIIIT